MEKGMTTKEINVTKRDGTKTPLDLDKVHRMVELACEGLAGVSESHVEVNSGLQFFDGIRTSDIQEILIRSANDLISGDVLILGASSVLPLIIIRGTIAQRAKNNIQNR